MDKIFVCTKLYIKYFFAYPQNVYIKLIYVPLQLILTMFLWSTISQTSSVDFKEMTTYYLLVFSVIYAYPFLRSSRNVGDDIFNGNMSNYLVRPVSYLYVTFSKFAAWIIVYSIIFLPMMIFVHFFNDYSILRILQFLVLVGVGMVIEMFIWVIIGSFTFYIEQVYGIAIMLNAVKNLLSGSLIPLEYLPSYVQSIANLSPFKFLVYVPVNFLQDNSLGFISTLGASLLCLVIVFVVQQVLWRQGVKSYQNNFS